MQEPEQLVAGGVAADDADGDDPRAQRMHVMGRVGGAAEEHLALRVPQDEDRRLARDPRGLAEQVLVGDEVTDDHDGAIAEARDGLVQAVTGIAHAATCLASAHSTASRRSPVPGSGTTSKRSRWYSHSPRP